MSEAIMVTYDVTESDADRRARLKSGRPAPTYAFMACTATKEEIEHWKRMQEQVSTK